MKTAVLLLSAFLAVASSDTEVISLDSDKWLLSDSSGRVKNLQATVPGQVHTDL